MCTSCRERVPATRRPNRRNEALVPGRTGFKKMSDSHDDGTGAQGQRRGAAYLGRSVGTSQDAIISNVKEITELRHELAYEKALSGGLERQLYSCLKRILAYI